MPQKTKQTPMMEQYFSIKADYQDAFLFYRLGDFYELFYDDAVKVAQILELTLTSRNKNAVDPIPMCGVPHHAAQGYIETLIEQGHKVAICEQVEDPKTTKGMVKREVVQLITPGTMMTGRSIEAKENNYLTAIAYETDEKIGFSYVDLSTGELKTTLLTSSSMVVNELMSLQTKELVLTTDVPDSLQTTLEKRMVLVFSKQMKATQNPALQQLSEKLPSALEKEVTNRLLAYLELTQKRSLDHLQEALSYEPNQSLKMDHYSKFNLELQQSIRTGKKQGTLLWLLDETKTAMGGRLLKQWIDSPLIDEGAIVARQEKVASLLNAYFERLEIQDLLTGVYDLERLAGRVAFGSVNGRDLLQLKHSLQQVPAITRVLSGIDQGQWQSLLQNMDSLDELVVLIEQAIHEEAPLQITEGNLIKNGFDETLDRYRETMKNGKQWLAELEAKERQATGIKTLKIGFNRVFGYYIEITKANLGNLEEGRYERKQTLANAERFITPELKKLETMILEAEEKSVDLEYRLFLEVRETVKNEIQRLQKLAKQLSMIDVLQSFATISERYQYVQPTFTESRHLNIVEGRHPVVEKVLGQQEYIPNSIEMDDKTMILLITGPNMSGKSTYMRQLAVTVVMAQIGCFVPAKQAQMPIFDQIFTRIGASDDLIAGQSTFMVEMMEANEALRHATPNSLILFDELGRGTATYDGMALAQAIIEYIHENVHAKTLFSTHYHELTRLEDACAQLKNIHVGAVEENGEVVFLHKIMAGPADKSYGIHVAKIAGLPENLLKRADHLLQALEGQEKNIQVVSTPEEPIIVKEILEETPTQLSLFAEETAGTKQVIEQLQKLNLLETTPLDALNFLHQLKKEL